MLYMQRQLREANEKRQRCKAHETSKKFLEVKEITQKESTRCPSHFLCREHGVLSPSTFKNQQLKLVRGIHIHIYLYIYTYVCYVTPGIWQLEVRPTHCRTRHTAGHDTVLRVASIRGHATESYESMRP